MKDYKNYLIAILTGLLILSVSAQASEGAGTSSQAKAIQYTHCLKAWSGGSIGTPVAIEDCKKYQP